MIKAIIIDDEPHCVKALQHDLTLFCPEVVVSDKCYSAKEGLLSIKRNDPDLIFLDVEMPWMNGFELLDVLGKEVSFQIIFTTAYDQFAARAFRVSAVDYLLKPIDGADLVDAIAKVKNCKPEIGNETLNNLLQNIKAPAAEQRIAIPTREGYKFVAVVDIVYCKANGGYTDVVLANGANLLLSKPLGEVEGLLPPEYFERIHHSLVVNIRHVAQFNRSASSSIVMDNGEELTVAKSKKEQLLLRLGVR